MNENIAREISSIKGKLKTTLVLLGIKLALFSLFSGMFGTLILAAPFVCALIVYLDFDKYKNNDAIYIVGIVLCFLTGGVLSGIFYLLAYLDLRKLILYLKQHEIDDIDKVNENVENVSTKKRNEAFPQIKKVEEVISPEAKKMDILMKFGVALVMIAGFLLATSTSNSLAATYIKPLVILLLSLMFYGLSIFFKTKIVIKKSEKSYYILFHLFIFLFFISLGYYQTLGEWFSFDGDGSYIFLMSTSLLASLLLVVISKKFEIPSLRQVSYFGLYLSLIFVSLFLEVELSIFWLIILIFTGMVTLVLKHFFENELNNFVAAKSIFLVLCGIFILFNINGLEFWDEFIINLVLFVLFIGNIILEIKDEYRKIGSIILSMCVVYFDFFFCKMINESFPEFLESAISFIFILNVIYISLHLYNSKTKQLDVSFNFTLIFMIILNTVLSMVSYYNYIGTLLMGLVLLAYIIYGFLCSTNNSTKTLLLLAQYILIFVNMYLVDEFIYKLSGFVIDTYYILFAILIIVAIVNYFEDKFLKEVKLDIVLNGAVIVATGFLGLVSLFEISVVFNVIIFALLVAYRLYFDKVDRKEVFLNYYLILLGFIHLTNVIGLLLFDYVHIIVFIISLICMFIFRKNKRFLSIVILLSFIPYAHFIVNLPILEEIIKILIILPLFGLVHVVSKCIFDCDDKVRFIIEIIGMSIIILSYIFIIDVLYALLNFVLALLFIFIGNKFEKFNSLFYEGIGLMIANIIIQFKDYWISIPPYVYILVAGLLIVGYVTYKEFNKTKNKDVVKKEDKAVVYYEKKEYNTMYNVLGFAAIVSFLIMNGLYILLIEDVEAVVEMNKLEKMVNKYIDEKGIDKSKVIFNYNDYSYDVILKEYNTIDPYDIMEYLDVDSVDLFWLDEEHFKKYKNGDYVDEYYVSHFNDYYKNVYYTRHSLRSNYFDRDEIKPNSIYNTGTFSVEIKSKVYNYEFREENLLHSSSLYLDFNEFETKKLDFCVHSEEEVSISTDGNLEEYVDDGTTKCYYLSNTDTVSFNKYYSSVNDNYFNDGSYVNDGNNNYYVPGNNFNSNSEYNYEY